MEIKKGDWFECVKDVIMSCGEKLYYTKGNYYKSENNKCITDNNGNEFHEWDSSLCDYNENIIFRPRNTPINPKHYSFNIKGTHCDIFDIGNAMDLNKEQFTALRYFRKKENQIEDTKKAIKCLERLVERLESEKNK